MTTALDEQPAIPVRRRAENPWLRRVMVFLTCVVAADALFGERGIAERARVIERYGQAEQELRAVRTENADLRDYIGRLRTDSATIESIARAELGLAKRGELLIVIRDK